MGRPQKIRSTRAARCARRQHRRPTASRRARWAGSTGTTPQPTSSQMRITSGLAESSPASSSSGQFSSPAKTGLARASSGVRATWSTVYPVFSST